MLSFAFKNAARSAELETGIARATDEEIARFTGGKFCHVEAWIEGPINAAVCYSARQPDGVGRAVLDLSDTSLWTIVTRPFFNSWIQGFCDGSVGKPYDFAGILGIASDTNAHIEWDRFCSEFCFELLQIGTNFHPSIKRWHVAPSGQPKGGYGLYELLTGEQHG